MEIGYGQTCKYVTLNSMGSMCLSLVAIFRGEIMYPKKEGIEQAILKIAGLIFLMVTLAKVLIVEAKSILDLLQH
jgi:hypothetical protein